MITMRSVPKRRPGTAWQEIEREIVILPPGEERLIGLNDAAGRIWLLADGTRTAAQIAADLGLVYDAPGERLATDTIGCLELFAARGWIEVGGE